MSRDLAGAIIAARRTHEAAVSVRAANLVGADPDAFEREVDAQFRDLATALGYLVTRDPLEAGFVEVPPPNVNASTQN